MNNNRDLFLSARLINGNSMSQTELGGNGGAPVGRTGFIEREGDHELAPKSNYKENNNKFPLDRETTIK